MKVKAVLFSVIFATNSAVLPGRKSGKGCYVYQPGIKAKDVNPDVLEILEKFRMTPNPAV